MTSNTITDRDDNEEWVKPNVTSALNDLIQLGYDYLTHQQELCQKLYGLLDYERWYYNQYTGILTFSDSGVDKLAVTYEEVGSVSKISKTWLWSWANPHLEEKIKTEVLLVKAYGEEFNLEHLTKQKWYADEYDAWEMTGIAAYLMKAQGAYRVPNENTFSFMIFKNILDLR